MFEMVMARASAIACGHKDAIDLDRLRHGTVSAAIGLGLRLWIAGLVLWALGHVAAVWAAKRDPLFVEVVRRHLHYPALFGS